MRYEILQNLRIPKIGFGTWSIGGRETGDTTNDAHSLSVLCSALEIGYRHFDTAEYYAAGHTEELLGQAVREMRLPREELFITSKVSPEHLDYQAVLRSCENSLRRLGMDYIDLYLIHWPAKDMRLDDAFRALNTLVNEGKVRHLGVSNFNLELLVQSCALAETPILTNQVPYSYVEREYVENGVLNYCQTKDILLTAYSPVKRRNIKINKKLQKVAERLEVKVEQIALAWLVQQSRVITIPKSANPLHQAENFNAGEMFLGPQELEMLS